MKTAAWNQLVDLQERQIRSLLSYGLTIEVQIAAFQEALNRVSRSIASGAAETPPAYAGPTPLELLHGGKAGRRD
jgi:hypothetical protein